MTDDTWRQVGLYQHLGQDGFHLFDVHALLPVSLMTDLQG
jgi:hypothetical protein